MGATRPTSIIRFERLYLGSLLIIALVIGVAGAAGGWEAIRTGTISPADVLLVLAFGLGLPLLLVLFVSRRRSNAAKWALVALFAFGLAMNLWTGRPGNLSFVTLAIAAMQGIGIGFLFSASARAWLAGRPGPELRRTFE